MNCKIWMFVIFLTALPTWAQESTHVYPSTDKVVGKPLKITWQDGRVAQVFMNNAEIETHDIPLTPVSNSCKPNVMPHCTYVSHLRFPKLALVWIKNPKDRTREGKVLESSLESRMYMSDQSKADKNYMVSWTIESPFSPGFYKDLKPEEVIQSHDALQCDSFNWMPNGNKTVLIDQMNSEFEGPVYEFTNNGSYVSRNQLLSTVSGVHLASEVNSKKFVSWDFAASHGFFASPAVAYKMEMIFNRTLDDTKEVQSIDNQCRVVFSIDFNSIFASVSPHFSDKTFDTKNAREFIYDPSDPRAGKVFGEWMVKSPPDNPL